MCCSWLFSSSWIHHTWRCSESFHCTHSSIALNCCKNVSLGVSPVVLESCHRSLIPVGTFWHPLGCTSNESSLKLLGSAVFSSTDPCRVPFPFAKASDNLGNSAMHPFIPRKNVSHLFPYETMLLFHFPSRGIYFCKSRKYLHTGSIWSQDAPWVSYNTFVALHFLHKVIELD